MESEKNIYRSKGMRGLFVIWSGQMISGIAASAAFFAQIHWISTETGASGTALAYWESFYFAAYLLFILFALFFVDHLPRKMLMLFYEFLLACATLGLLLLEAAGVLQVWHLYLSAVILGMGHALWLPTYTSVITILVPRKQHVRANGMLSLVYDMPDMLAPLLVSVLYVSLGLKGFLIVNLIAFAFSIAALLVTPIPQAPAETLDLTLRALFREAADGVLYILERPGLLGIQMIFFVGNIFLGIALSFTALYTMIALRTGGNIAIADTIQSAEAWAAVVAGLVITVFGRIKRPVIVILMGWFISSLLGLTLFGVGQILVVWVIAAVIEAFFGPVMDVAFRKLIQSKVEPEFQGRVFAASDFLSQAPFFFAPLLAGYVGDKIFEPLMQTSGSWMNAFGWLVGVGPGAGYGLMIFLCGVGGALVGVWGYFNRSVRFAEENMPDIVLPPPVGLVRKTQPIPSRTTAQDNSSNIPG